MMKTPARARTRRTLAALSGLTLMIGLAACSADGGATSTSAESGTIRVGMLGSTADLLAPQTPQTTAIDTARGKQIWEGLSTYAPDGTTKLVLAESMTPSENNTVWTVTLRPDIPLHNGETFTADDVVASIKHVLDPATGSGAAGSLAFIDPDTDIQVVDDRTLVFTLDVPYGDFASLWASDRILMANWSTGEPIGTGPFQPESFTAGQESTFSRFDDYWGEKASFETLEIINFRDTDAVANALRGGQIDIAPNVPFTNVSTLEQSGISILETENAALMPTIEFRTDIAPFNDPQVLEAMKLIIDREAVAQNVYGGFARPANDIPSNLSPCEPPAIPQREQDLDEAKKLLASAGQSDLAFELTVSDATGAGAVELAQLFAQHAADAGVTVTVNKIDLATFFLDWMNWPAYIAYADESLPNTVNKSFLTGTNANGTHFADPEFDALAAEMFATSDEATRCDLVGKMQTILHDRSGWIFPASVTAVTAYNDRVTGLAPHIFGQSGTIFAGVSLTE